MNEQLHRQSATTPTWSLRRSGGLGALLSKTIAVLRITIAARLAYIGEILIRTSFLVMVLYIFTQLWRTTNGSQDVVALTGFEIPQLIWYLAFTEAIIMSAVALGENDVDREVRSGDIAYRLARPLPYPLYHLGAALGERLLRFVLNLIVGALVALIVVGPIPLAPLSLLAAFSAALLGFVVDWIWTFTISLLSFWVEDTMGLHLLYRRAQMLLGGMLIPLSAYPEWLGNITRLLPFQYLVYQPARLFVETTVTGWFNLMATLALIGLVSLLPMLAIYHLGLRRVSAQGG
ncbi:MAG TPA: ABC-2 family transporter protein [Herpetosiphonaceae bacterium]